MKKFLPIFFIVIAGCTSVADPNSFYQYGFHTAKIEYSVSGATVGTSTLIIKGDKMARETHITVHKSSGDTKQNNLTIYIGEFIYSIDLDKKTANKSTNPDYKTLASVPTEQRQETLKKLALAIPPDQIATKEITSLGTETVAGQVCDVYITDVPAKVCLWNGLPLKTILGIPTLGLTSTNIATSVQTELDVPDTTFEIPTGITLQK